MPKMKFHEDKFVDGKVFAHKDEVVDVADESVHRWIKRGGQLVEEKSVLDDKPPEKDEPEKETVVKRGPGRPPKALR